MKSAVAVGMDGFISRTTANPIEATYNFDLAAWLAHVTGVLECSRRGDPCHLLHAVIVWPPQHDRGRVYVHLLDETGRAVGFAKISFDETNNRSLDNEARTLNTLHGLNLQRSHTPRVLHHGHFEEHTFLVLEPIPEHAQSARLSPTELLALAEEYAGPSRRISRDELESLDWWQRWREIAHHTPAFAEAVEAAVADGLHVCRVHGDLGPENAILVKGQPWLFDWEHASELGPTMTDRICTWFAPNHRLITRRPDEAARSFAADFLAPGTPARDEALTALGYLCAVRHGSAARLVANMRTD